MINHPNRSTKIKRAAVTYSIREKTQTVLGKPVTEWQVMHGNKIVDRFYNHAAADARLNGLLGKGNGFRVVYGETMPAWEQTFATLREAKVFALKHESFGDVVFSISPVVPGEEPKSLTGHIDAGRPVGQALRDLKASY